MRESTFDGEPPDNEAVCDVSCAKGDPLPGLREGLVADEVVQSQPVLGVLDKCQTAGASIDVLD